MFEVRVTADFSAAHFLRDYNGKCENLHGHNYKVYAHVRGTELDRGGMLLDFTKLKKTLREVCGKIDHTNLNDIEFFEQNPSAERIAVYIYKNMLKVLSEKGLDLSKNSNRRISKVDVFETEKNRARYIPE